MNSEKLEFGYESVSILASFFVNAGGKIHPCRSVIVDFGLGDINPGMVPDGAKCGEDKVKYKSFYVNVVRQKSKCSFLTNVNAFMLNVCMQSVCNDK